MCAEYVLTPSLLAKLARELTRSSCRLGGGSRPCKGITMPICCPYLVVIFNSIILQGFRVRIGKPFLASYGCCDLKGCHSSFLIKATKHASIRACQLLVQMLLFLSCFLSQLKPSFVNACLNQLDFGHTSIYGNWMDGNNTQIDLFRIIRHY